MRSDSRTTLLFAAHLLGLLCLACPLGRPADSDLRPIGPEVRASLVIYFKSGATQEQISSFTKEVLSRPHPEGRGHYQPVGVQSLLRVRAVQGHEGIAITFFPNATDEQRQNLRDAVNASPVVYKVLENVSPADVKALD